MKKINYRAITFVAPIIFLFFSLLLISSSKAYASSKNKISNVEVKETTDSAKIVFETNGLPLYRVFSISKPERLVIDIQGGDLEKAISHGASSNLFQSVRNSYNNSSLRVVFNLNKKIHIQNSEIINPKSAGQNYQLVINLSKNDLKPDNKIAATVTDYSPSQNIKTEEVKNKAKTPTVSSATKIATGAPAKTLAQIDTKKTQNETPLNSTIADKILETKEDKTTGTITYKVRKNEKYQEKWKTPVVVIDAGHGGKDPGTIGNYLHTKEKNITIAYARELKKSLDQTKKFKVFLTRYDDSFIELGKRVEISRKLKADLFISIHANSAENKEASGFSIYTLSEKSSDAQAELLAQKENKADIIGGANLYNASDDVLKTLISLSQRDNMNNSAKFAEIIIKTLNDDGIEILENTHRFAGFKVLTAPDMVATLIELGYLSNKEEEKKLNNINYRKKVADGITKSAISYFSKNMK